MYRPGLFTLNWWWLLKWRKNLLSSIHEHVVYGGELCLFPHQSLLDGGMHDAG